LPVPFAHGFTLSVVRFYTLYRWTAPRRCDPRLVHGSLVPVVLGCSHSDDGEQRWDRKGGVAIPTIEECQTQSRPVGARWASGV